MITQIINYTLFYIGFSPKILMTSKAVDVADDGWCSGEGGSICNTEKDNCLLKTSFIM